MPAEKFTKSTDTPKKKRQWKHVYDSVKERGGDAADAVKQANSVVSKKKGK